MSVVRGGRLHRSEHTHRGLQIDGVDALQPVNLDLHRAQAPRMACCPCLERNVTDIPRATDPHHATGDILAQDALASVIRKFRPPLSITATI